MAYISDTYGPRLWESEPLERVIQEIASMTSKEGFDSVHRSKISQGGKEELKN